MSIKIVSDDYTNDSIFEFLGMLTSYSSIIDAKYGVFSIENLVFLYTVEDNNLPELDSGVISSALNVFSLIVLQHDYTALKIIMHFIYKHSQNGALLIYILDGFSWYVSPNELCRYLAPIIVEIVNENRGDYPSFLILYLFTLMYELLMVDNLDIVSDTYNVNIIRTRLYSNVSNKHNIHFVLRTLSKNIRSTQEVVNEFDGYYNRLNSR